MALDFLSPITAPTPSSGDDSTNVATTEWVNDAIQVALTGGPVDLSDYYTKGEADGRFQPLDPELTALAGLTPTPNQIIFYDDASAPALTTLAPFTRALFDNTSAAEWRTDLGIALGSQIQSWDIVLDILSSIAPATDTVPYFTDSGHASTAAFTQTGRDIVGATDASDLRSIAGLAIGTNVQAFDANLQAIADLTTAPDKLTYWTGEGDAALTDISAFGRSWLALTDASGALAAMGAQANYPALDKLGLLNNETGLLLVSTATAWDALPVGTDGQLLVANSLAAGGMSWTTPTADMFGLGDMANQVSTNVNIAGGTISGVAFSSNNATITGGLISGVTLSNVPITNLPYPVNDDDAATKKFVEDSLGAGTTDAELLAIAGLASAANTIPYFTGPGAADLLPINTFGKQLLNTDAGALQAALHVVPNVDVMAYNAALVAFSNLAPTKGNVLVGTGSAWDVLPKGTNGYVLQVDSTAPGGLSYTDPGTFGLADMLSNLADLMPVANDLPIFTGVDTWSKVPTSALGRAWLNVTDAAEARGALGLIIGQNVQAYDPQLDQFATRVAAKGNLIVGLDVGWSQIAPGADNTVLVADASTASGLAWKDLSLDNTLPSALNALADLDTSGGGLLKYTGTNSPTLLSISPVSEGLLALPYVESWQAALGLAPGTNVQAHNAKLDAIVALGWEAHKGLILTGGNTLGTFTLTDSMAALMGSADNAALIDTLGLTVGSDVQSWHAGLDDLGSLTPVDEGTLAVWKLGHWVTFAPGEDTQILQANSLADGGLRWVDMFSSSGSGSEGALPEALGVLGQVTPAADRLPYFNSSTTATITPLTSFGRSLIDDVDAAHARTTLGLQIGVDIQGHSARLDSIDGMTWAVNKGIMATGTNALGTFDLTPAARTLLDDADTAAMRTTLGLGIGTDVQAYNANLAAWAAKDPGDFITNDGAASGYQPLDAGLSAISSITPTVGNLLVGGASSWEALGAGADGQALIADSAAVSGIKWGKAGGVDVQVFTQNGHWVPDGTPKYVRVIAIGGGGSGGGGPRSTSNGGGSGGGGGFWASVDIPFSDIDLSAGYVDVIVAAAKAGGAGNNAGSPGGDGLPGDPSSFGSYVKAFGGGLGKGGNATVVAGGSGAGLIEAGKSGGGSATIAGGEGGGGDGSNGIDVGRLSKLPGGGAGGGTGVGAAPGRDGGRPWWGGGGGGGGGSGANPGGGAYDQFLAFLAAGAANNPGRDGTRKSPWYAGGGGSGGGGGNTGQNGGKGGNGHVGGGGGGGGAGGLSGGQGGDGGRGEVIVIAVY